MEIFLSLLALVGMGWAMWRGIKWMLRTGRAQAAKAESLTPADLRLLEESAERLMADMRATADECVAAIERACAAAQSTPGAASPARRSIFDVMGDPNSPAEIARQAGLTTGEVELMRSLQAAGSHENQPERLLDIPAA